MIYVTTTDLKCLKFVANLRSVILVEAEVMALITNVKH